MWPMLKRVANAMLFDELAVRRWARGALLTFAAGGVAFADQLADLVHAPGAVKTIKVIAVICGFIGGAISHGEPNASVVEVPKP